jgi:hypothetical protein
MFFCGLLLGNLLGLKHLNADIEQLVFEYFFLGFHYGGGTDLLGIMGGTASEQN